MNSERNAKNGQQVGYFAHPCLCASARFFNHVDLIFCPWNEVLKCMEKFLASWNVYDGHSGCTAWWEKKKKSGCKRF